MKRFKKMYLFVIFSVGFLFIYYFCSINKRKTEAVVKGFNSLSISKTLLDKTQDNQNEFLNEENILKWIENRKSNKITLTRLGKILYYNEEYPKVDNEKQYQILIWKYGPTIEKRHVMNFTNTKIDPFEHCSVKNCNLTYKDSAIETADIVIYHMQRMKGLIDMPKVKRNPKQLWAFLTDESPFHMFMHNKNNKLKDYNGLFNWSMHYGFDADIPVPYGRTILKKEPSTNVELVVKKRRDVLIGILISDCGGINNRWAYINELKKHITIDIYGGCGNKKCPGYFRKDCPSIEEYLFYLAFENSNCDQYITEKVWWNSFHKNSIPIVMGDSSKNYERFLPLKSYIHTDDFVSPKALAEYLLHLNQTNNFQQYYQWKQYFEVLNEHGYFQSGSIHYCRVCEALNYNDKSTKILDNLQKVWSPKKDCHPSWNVNN